MRVSTEPGEQCIAVGISTKEYDDSIQLADSFTAGELTLESFVSPWAVVSLLETDIERAVAQVEDTVTNEVAKRLTA